MNPLIKELSKKIAHAIAAAGYEVPLEAELVRPSDRPDLSDFQSNVSMGIVKSARKNPAEIASAIAAALVEGASAAGGFINIKVAPALVEKLVNKLDDRLGTPLTKKPETIVIDFAQPNVAKAMHAGHFRGAIIGETLKNLALFMGHKVIGDHHLGDWGLPMGMLIAAIKEKQIKMPIDVDTLNKLYPESSARAKEDKEFYARAAAETKKLQDGDKETRAIWKSFTETSKKDMKTLLARLGIDMSPGNPDLWLGESDADPFVQKLLADKSFTKHLKLDDGAQVIRLDDYPMNGSPVPPFIAIKSNGAVMYGMTDMGTMFDRIKNMKADRIWYLTDSRQTLHFHQIFHVAEIVGLKGKTELAFLSHGSLMGKDGKPFKTRSGAVALLEDFLNEVEEKAGSRQIALSAIKFADMINPITSDYIFDPEKFLSFEGKTGPYVLYTAVRIKSLLEKAPKPGAIHLTNEYDKKLAILLLGFADAAVRAFELKSPHIFVQYIYDLAVAYNAFYHKCNIAAEADKATAASWTALSKITLQALEMFAKIISVEIPERM